MARSAEVSTMAAPPSETREQSSSRRGSAINRLAITWSQSHDDRKAIEVIDLALAREPDNPEAVESKSTFLWNIHANDPAPMLPYYDDCIRRRIPPVALWHVRKAEVHVSLGSRWVDGDDGLVLRPHASLLRRERVVSPYLRWRRPGRSGIGSFERCSTQRERAKGFSANRVRSSWAQPPS